MTWVAPAAGLLALAGELLSVWWHAEREGGRPLRSAGVAAALEALTWAPLLAAVELGGAGAWQVAGASVAGAAAGSGVGVWLRARARR